MTENSSTPPLSPRELRPELFGGSAFYMTGEDKLRVVSLNSVTGVKLQLVGRFLKLNGEIVPFGESHTPNTDRTQATSDFAFGEGWLLNAAVYVSAGTPQPSQTFVALRVVRGQLGATQELATISRGYCTAGERLHYPGSTSRSPTDCRGAFRAIAGTDPAAGVEIAETVPTGARWRVIAFRTRLLTSATVATRYPSFQIYDGTGIVWQADPPSGSLATTGFYYQFGDTTPRLPAGIDTQIWCCPRDLWLEPGWQIKTVTTSLQAGDDYTAPYYLVEEQLRG